jgi:hypothetical protein
MGWNQTRGKRRKERNGYLKSFRSSKSRRTVDKVYAFLFQ